MLHVFYFVNLKNLFHFSQKSARLNFGWLCAAWQVSQLSELPFPPYPQLANIGDALFFVFWLFFFSFLLWPVHPPSPSHSLAVISFISCGHVSLAVLTQGAPSRGLNPHRLPFTKNRRDHLNEGIVCHPSNLSSNLSDPPTMRRGRTQKPFIHF